MWKNEEGLMVIRAFVHLVKAGRQPFAADEGGRAAILCRQARRRRVQVAHPACRHEDAGLHIDVYMKSLTKYVQKERLSSFVVAVYSHEG